MKYKLTDDQFMSRLRDFLLLDTNDFVPVMLAESDPNRIDRAETLKLASYAGMSNELTKELFAEEA